MDFIAFQAILNNLRLSQVASQIKLIEIMPKLPTTRHFLLFFWLVPMYGQFLGLGPGT